VCVRATHKVDHHGVGFPPSGELDDISLDPGAEECDDAAGAEAACAEVFGAEACASVYGYFIMTF
jgi:hypothetical protein